MSNDTWSLQEIENLARQHSSMRTLYTMVIDGNGYFLLIRLTREDGEFSYMDSAVIAKSVYKEGVHCFLTDDISFFLVYVRRYE